MISRIVSYCFLGMLFFALFLAILGVKQVGTGEEYYRFLGTVSQRFDAWKIEIPNIPKLNRLENTSSGEGWNIFDAFRAFVNFLVNFVNVLIGILNIVILVVNIVIQVLQFVTTLLFSLKDLVSRLAELNT